jgi:hypothetical protein
MVYMGIPFIKKQKIKKQVLLVSVFLLLLVLSYYLIQSAIRSTIKDNKLQLLIVGVFYFFLGFFVRPAFERASKKFDQWADKLLDEIKRFSKGIRGEEVVYQELKAILGTDYFIKRNFEIPNGGYDIDMVVVGPKGIFVAEVKNVKDRTLFREDGEYYIDKDGQEKKKWKTFSYKINQHGDGFRQFLHDKGLVDIVPRQVLVFAKKGVVKIDKGVKLGGFWVCDGVEELRPYFERWPVDGRYTPAFCNEIIKALSAR